MNPNNQPDFLPTAILETVLYCPDLDAARHFYEQIIGLRIYSFEPDRHLFYKVGGSMLLIFNPENTQSQSVTINGATLPLHGGTGESHFAFQVEAAQFAPIKANLSQHGVAIECELDWPGGGHSIYCRDPAGNSVEFATRSLWFQDTEVE